MTNRLFQPLQLLAREAGDAARATLWRAALLGGALIIAALGAGFLISAAYLGLRFLVGPGWAALAMAAALSAAAAGLWLFVQDKMPSVRPKSLAVLRQGQLASAPPPAGNAATMAVFTAAFLIGRHLADRWGQSRNF